MSTAWSSTHPARGADEGPGRATRSVGCPRRARRARAAEAASRVDDVDRRGHAGRPAAAPCTAPPNRRRRRRSVNVTAALDRPRTRRPLEHIQAVAAEYARRLPGRRRGARPAARRAHVRHRHRGRGRRHRSSRASLPPAQGPRARRTSKFQTAVVRRSLTRAAGERRAHELRVDVASTRTEFYDFPAALPKVEHASIRNDLARRDFCINAMAVSLKRARLRHPARLLRRPRRPLRRAHRRAPQPELHRRPHAHLPRDPLREPLRPAHGRHTLGLARSLQRHGPRRRPLLGASPRRARAPLRRGDRCRFTLFAASRARARRPRSTRAPPSTSAASGSDRRADEPAPPPRARVGGPRLAPAPRRCCLRDLDPEEIGAWARRMRFARARRRRSAARSPARATACATASARRPTEAELYDVAAGEPLEALLVAMAIDETGHRRRPSRGRFLDVTRHVRLEIGGDDLLDWAWGVARSRRVLRQRPAPEDQRPRLGPRRGARRGAPCQRRRRVSSDLRPRVRHRPAAAASCSLVGCTSSPTAGLARPASGDHHGPEQGRPLAGNPSGQLDPPGAPVSPRASSLHSARAGTFLFGWARPVPHLAVAIVAGPAARDDGRRRRGAGARRRRSRRDRRRRRVAHLRGVPLFASLRRLRASVARRRRSPDAQPRCRMPAGLDVRRAPCAAPCRRARPQHLPAMLHGRCRRRRVVRGAFPGSSFVPGRPLDGRRGAAHRQPASSTGRRCSGLCTVCDERFFSHRRDAGLTGRQAAIAWIPDQGRADGSRSRRETSAMGLAPAVTTCVSRSPRSASGSPRRPAPPAARGDEVEILVATKYVDADGLGALREAGIRWSARTAPRTWSRSTSAGATPSPGTSSATCRAARPSWCCRSCA